MNKKICFKAMLWSLFLTFGCTPPIMAESKAPRSVPGTAIFVMARPHTVGATAVKLTTDKAYLKLDMSVPQLSGLSDQHFQKQLNQQLLSEAKKRQNAIGQLAASYQEDLTSDHLNSIHFEYIESFTPIKSQSPYYVIEQYQYQYSGGAHGMSTLSYLVLNTKTNAKVGLKDLFKENVDYQAVVNAEVSKLIQVKTNQGQYFFTGADGFQGIGDEQPFFINEQGDIVIVFNVYEIAPYAAGPQFMIIPQQTLAPYLK